MSFSSKWYQVFDIDYGPRMLDRVEARLDDLERRRENLEINFRPGLVNTLKQVEGMNRFETGHLDTEITHQKLCRILRSYRATGYIQSEERCADNKRYSIDPIKEELAFDYSKLKEAETAEEIIKTGTRHADDETPLDPGKITEELSEIIEAVENNSKLYFQHHEKAPRMSTGTKLISDEKGSYDALGEYSLDTLKYLNQLELAVENNSRYQLIGGSKDYQVAQKVAEELKYKIIQPRTV